METTFSFRTLKSFLVSACAVSFLASPLALANNYSEDFNNLFEALQQSKLKTDALFDFQDPYAGKSTFLLPTKKAPWAANYFPMYQGGIANRWQQGGFPAADEKYPTKEQVKKMTSKEIDKLSPAEKYDIYVGDYDFSVTKHELFTRGPYRSYPVAEWEGFCNGVRCAGYSVPEPKEAIDVVNADGIKIRFQAADLKALAGASFFYAENYADMGSPTRSENLADNQPNAAAFDVALRYYLADRRKAFVVDMNLGPEIWNESVVGYSRKVSSKSQLSKSEVYRFPKAASKVIVKLRLYTLGEISMEQSNGKTKSKVAGGQMHKETPMSYTLYLDANGKTIDGAWRESSVGNRGVDFAWFTSGKGMDASYTPDIESNYTGNKFLKFETLEKLVRRSSGPLKCKALF